MSQKGIFITCFLVLLVSGNGYAGLFGDIVSEVKKTAVDTISESGVQKESIQQKAQMLSLGNSSEVIDNGVFYVPIEAKSGQQNNLPVTVFDIPLGSTIQEAVTVLDKKGIDIHRGCMGEREMKMYLESLKKKILDVYESRGVIGAEKEDALKVFDENKIKFYPLKYKDEKLWLTPYSLNFWLDANIRPVFGQYYGKYNSTFCLQLKDLSEDIQSQGISAINLVFGSVNQEEPKLFLINLVFIKGKGNDKLAAILNKKYGPPQLFYSPIRNNGSYSWPADNQRFQTLFSYLRSKSAGYEERKPKDIIEAAFLKYLVVSDVDIIRSAHYIGVNEGYMVTGIRPDEPPGPSGLFNFVLDWDAGDVKIVGGFLVESTLELNIIPRTANYILWPFAKEITGEAEEIIKASQESVSKSKSNAENSF